MSRSKRDRWLSSKTGNRRRSATRRRSVVPFSRRLRFEPLEDRRLLANVTVGNLNDVVNGTTTSIADLIATPGADGISLREAITAANADAAADTIDFSVTGTIQLTNVGHAGEIAIDSNVTINGPGANLLSIRAFAGTAALGDGARIFNIQTLFTRTVTISGLTLTGGDVASTYGGGAILNFENLTITGCTISGNRATDRGGGITNRGGNLSVIASTISGNTTGNHGGGIYSRYGNLSVSRSTVSGNVALNGGGIYSFYSAVTIDSSTISGNSAAGSGGLSIAGSGVNTITNSTVSGNSAQASAAGVFVAGNVSVRHSTITLNRADSDNNGSGTGGGVLVASGSQATLDHTIVAGNLRGTSTRDDVSGAVVASSAFNLIGVNTGLTGISDGANGNQIGTGASPIDARLFVLANNGGPTLTHAFLPGSPAVDAGDEDFAPPPANDQRGAPLGRVADGDGVGGARIDIGAYEQQTTAAASIIVDTLADENDGNFSAGDLSLREAISVANNSVGLDTITFAASLTSGGPATILLMIGELVVFDSTTIEGPGAHLLTIDASGNDPTATTNDGLGTRVFAIDDGSMTTMIEVAIIGLTLTGGDAPSFGGGIFNAENLTLANSTISGNAVGFAAPGAYDDDGGGIFNRGNMTIDGSTISGNNARNVGGGIQNESNMTIVGSTISGNFAGREFSQYQQVEPYGGGIFNRGNLTVRHSTITANNASTFPASFGTGEGIFNDFVGDLTLDHTIVAGNDPGHAGASNIAGTGLVFANFSIISGSIGLGPLADNGGPTFTHALLPGSPAIDSGNANFDPADPDGDPLTDDAVPYDQRGAPFVRVAGGRIDIGAYERQTVAGLNLVVDTTADEDDGDYSPGDLSLREAIDLANGFVGADTITFAAALSGATITLGGTELAISEGLVIDARPLAENVTIDANQQSRIFNITATTGDVTLGGLTLTGGSTNASGSAGGSGGAIRSSTSGNLTLDQSTVSGNSTTDFRAYGGGIRAGGAVTLTQSTVSGNSTTGNEAHGGGISTSDSGAVTLIQSTVSGNSTAGNQARGGGIFAGAVTLTQSTVSGNSTAGSSAHGGGILVRAFAMTLIKSTITDNHTLGGSSMGGGVYQSNFGNNSPFSISGSIVAGNTALAGGPDLVPDPQSTLTVNDSLIGVADLLTFTGDIGNLTGSAINPLDPLLGPLADNGGPTMTHALLAGSPAIDAGDPSFAPPPDFDQRGDPYTRIFDGDGAGGARIDMGAFELISDDAVHALFGDYNRDGTANAADYTVWRNASGNTGIVPYSGADGNGDGMITRADYDVWKEQYGETVPATSAGSGAALASGVGSEVLAVAPPQSEFAPATASSPAGVSDIKFTSIGQVLGESIIDTRQRTLTPALSQWERESSIWREREWTDRDAALLQWLDARRMDVRDSANRVAECTPEDGSGHTRPTGEFAPVDAVFDLLAAAI